MYPLVELDQEIHKKLKDHHIIDLNLFPLDGNGELNYIRVTFSDKTVFELHQPFNLDNLCEY